MQLEMTTSREVVVARWFPTLASIASSSTTMDSHAYVDRNRGDFVLIHVSVFYNFLCLHFFEKEHNWNLDGEYNRGRRRVDGNPFEAI